MLQKSVWRYLVADWLATSCTKRPLWAEQQRVAAASNLITWPCYWHPTHIQINITGLSFSTEVHTGTSLWSTRQFFSSRSFKADNICIYKAYHTTTACSIQNVRFYKIYDYYWAH